MPGARVQSACGPECWLLALGMAAVPSPSQQGTSRSEPILGGRAGVGGCPGSGGIRAPELVGDAQVLHFATGPPAGCHRGVS